MYPWDKGTNFPLLWGFHDQWLSSIILVLGDTLDLPWCGVAGPPALYPPHSYSWHSCYLAARRITRGAMGRRTCPRPVTGMTGHTLGMTDVCCRGAHSTLEHHHVTTITSGLDGVAEWPVCPGVAHLPAKQLSVTIRYPSQNGTHVPLAVLPWCWNVGLLMAFKEQQLCRTVIISFQMQHVPECGQNVLFLFIILILNSTYG